MGHRRGATMERIRHALPSDTRLWIQRNDFGVSSFAMSLSADMHQVKRAMDERGIVLETVGAGGARRIRIAGMRCRHEGCEGTAPNDGRRERLCDEHMPVAVHDPLNELYEFERAKQEVKRRVRRMAISAMVAARVERGDPLRRKPGRPRKRRVA